MIITLLSMVLLIGMNHVNAQTAPAPPGNRSSGNQSGGGSAPIGDDLILLLSMGAAYGGLKGYRFLKTGNRDEVK